MKKLKKGFTLVELVIVIAVIAVLAAVLIPTFSGIVQKSKISADQQTVSNMNTVLATTGSAGAPQDMGQAIAYLNQEGFTLNSLKATASGYNFAWDSDSNKMVLVDDKFNVKFPEEAKETTEKSDCWIIANSANAAQNAAKNAFNIYFSTDIATAMTLDGWVGVDTGVNKMTGKLTINGAANEDIVLRGSFNEVIVNNAQGSVDQFGSIKNLKIDAIANQCFNVNGVVDTVADVSAGKLINKGVINTVTAITNGSIQNEGFIKTTAPEAESKVDNANADSTAVINVATATELANIATAVNSGTDFSGITIALTNDIDLSNRAWTPIGATEANAFKGSFDGGNYTITGLANEGYLGYGTASQTVNLTNGQKGTTFGLFAFVQADENAELNFSSVTFANVNIDFSDALAVGALIGNIGGEGTVNVSSIYVNSGSIAAKDKVAGVIGLAGYAGDELAISVTNCYNNVAITAENPAKYNRAAGIIAASAKGQTLYISNCHNTGTITANQNGHAAGIVGSVNEATLSLSGDCTNTGTIDAGNTQNLTCDVSKAGSLVNNH